MKIAKYPFTHFRRSVMFLVLITAPVAMSSLITSSSTAPVPDGDDLFNFPATGANDILNGDRAAAGQTILTGATAKLINGFSYQAAPSSDRTISGTQWKVRLGLITGSTFTPILDEIVNTATVSAAPGDWITVTFDTPIELNASTQYGIELGKSGAGNWGSIGSTAGSGYVDGVAYRNTGSPNRWEGGTTAGFQSYDQVFHVDWGDTSVVPEPTTAAFSVFGALLFRALRRRRSSGLEHTLWPARVTP